MDVYTISDAGIEQHDVAKLAGLLTDPDLLIWVDMRVCADSEASVLSEVFGFHDLAVRDCVQRNHVSKIHAYDDHEFTVVHAPDLGTGGHVHYVELDQFVGPNYVVTVHGPLNPVVQAHVAARETSAVLRRVKEGALRPRSPMELSVAILSALVRHETDLVAQLARESGRLEQLVTDDDRDDDPEALLEELFVVRQELLAVRTMAAHASATYGRMAKLTQLSEADRALVSDIADRFELVCSIAEDQRDFVHGVIEFFQTRTSTHLTIATEKLTATSVRQNNDTRKISAWVAIIAVPTAVTGFFGQNVPYPGFAAHSGFYVSSAVIVVVAAALYVVFRLKKWL
ncbi:magnesium transporter CorA family protein [uncultured Jatrophihabitans sp.]|uniref:magnesium transporter CorA family protein n=1 Tax=uncultured Jatrophihabitans sp. TaxID=1610747 RepID=UPI0035C9A794